MEIKTYLLDLQRVENQSTSCIDAVLNPSFLKETIHYQIRELVIVQAFMQVCTAWEHFLEHSFIHYTLGGTSLRGNKPVCYINPRDETHSDLIIKGNSQYPDWATHSAIIKMAEKIFEDGEPYKSVLQMASSSFTAMKKIRNEIAHNSLNSKNIFDTLVRDTLSAGKVGISVAEYLISKKRSQPPFYEIYFGYIKDSAMKIANA